MYFDKKNGYAYLGSIRVDTNFRDTKFRNEKYEIFIGFTT
jgi:hypothetical protein